VIEEEARITKRVEETGAVRVRLESEGVDAPCDIGTTHESYEVERVPVGRVVEARREPWTDGDAVVVPVYEEVLVPRLVLKEEIRLVRHRRTEHAEGTVSLRRERAIVERRQPDGTWQPAEPAGARRETQEPSFDVQPHDRRSKT
jgi:stress response protein YsnF